MKMLYFKRVRSALSAVLKIQSRIDKNYLHLINEFNQGGQAGAITAETANEVTEIVSTVDRKLKGYKKACSKGCSHCCHQLIQMHIAEVPAVIQYMNNHFSELQMKHVKSRLADWFEFVKKLYPESNLLRSDEYYDLVDKVAEHRMACPFLMLQQCSIYEVRPVICRSYIVADQPEACKKNIFRAGVTESYKLNEQALKDISVITGNVCLQPLPYAVAPYFGIDARVRIKAGLVRS